MEVSDSFCFLNHLQIVPPTTDSTYYDELTYTYAIVFYLCFWMLYANQLECIDTWTWTVGHDLIHCSCILTSSLVRLALIHNTGLFLPWHRYVFAWPCLSMNMTEFELLGCTFRHGPMLFVTNVVIKESHHVGLHQSCYCNFCTKAPL